MIVGNRNAGKTIVAAIVVLLVGMIVITAILAQRKKTAPVQTPPLHASVALSAFLRGA